MAQNVTVAGPTQFTRTVRLKVKRESYPWLRRAAKEVNFVWNWANETSEKAVKRFSGPPVWLSGYDLARLTTGATEFFDHIGADTINCVVAEYAVKRLAAKRPRLRWRISGGSRRSLGWIPLKGGGLKRSGLAVRYLGKTIRVHQPERLGAGRMRAGCFVEDAVGDWWLCVSVKLQEATATASLGVVGIDLGLKTTATTSDGERLETRAFRGLESRIAQAQRRGHKRQAKRLSRKAARQRQDALHKFTTGIVKRYNHIVVGDVSSAKLVKTRMAKSVLDAGWYMLKMQLRYKGQQAGRCVEIVSEAYTTRACSSCGALTGPSGLRHLSVRAWHCEACGTSHDRDINAAKNIAMLGSRCGPPCGNGLKQRAARRQQASA
jgi:putative transposase